MLNYTYKILNYIRRHEDATRAKLLERFSKFEKYELTITDYVCIKDSNPSEEELEQEQYEKLIIEAVEKGINEIGKQSEYVSENRKDIKLQKDDSLISYAINFKFEEYREQRRRSAVMFWLPYTITTIIAFASLVAQFR